MFAIQKPAYLFYVYVTHSCKHLRLVFTQSSLKVSSAPPREGGVIWWQSIPFHPGPVDSFDDFPNKYLGLDKCQLRGRTHKP